MADEKTTKRQMTTYILSRCDLKSLSSGKSDAHAHHAGVQMIAKYYEHPDVRAYIEDGNTEGADHFNTTITLHATKAQIETVVGTAKAIGFLGDLVIDPSYPYWADREVAEVNGLTWVAESGDNVLLLRRELSFGWILGDRNDPIFKAIVANLKLKDFNKLLYVEK